MKKKLFFILGTPLLFLLVFSFKIFNGPVMTPAKPVFDFDTLVQGKKFHGKIPFQNTGNGNLFIMYATTSSADVVCQWNTNPVLPGKWDTISFDFSSLSKLGRQKFEINVVGNMENQLSVLKITGVVVKDTTGMKTPH